jgi:hypothetical protein
MEDSGKAGGEMDRQLMQFLNNYENHEQSAIIINLSQLYLLKYMIDLLKKESAKKDLTKTSRRPKTCPSTTSAMPRSAKKSSTRSWCSNSPPTCLPLSYISTLFEESNFTDISKSERRVKTKEMEVNKEIVSQNEDID